MAQKRSSKAKSSSKRILKTSGKRGTISRARIREAVAKVSRKSA